MRSPALTAATRFGLGPTRGAGPTREDLAAQLDDPAGAMIDGLDDFEAIRDRYLVRERAFRQAAIANRQETSEAKKAARVDAIKARRDVVRDIQLAEIGARYAHGVTTRNTFLERLVLFWSNHFAVEAKKVPVRVTVGNFERRAIRANVTGWFADMLKAAVTHPAMLFYLDNNASFGPNSMIGQRRGKSRINENLARELLELHTLGAGGGYTQADVNALALTLTGWTGGLNIRQVNPTFDERWHDHGPRTILGKTYTVEGEAQLHAVLDDLAAHPSTAINVATKFARHFVGDDASEALIEALRDSFTQSRGDLWELSYTLIAHPDAWAPEAAKAVPPYDFMVSVGRALGARRVPPKLVERATRDLGQPIWDPPSPAGWSYFDNDFLGGDSLLERVDFVRTVAQRFGKRADARKLARTLLGADLDPFVAETVDRAEDRDQALVLLLIKSCVSAEVGMIHPSRRAVLAGGVAFSAWASIPSIARAAGARDPRFVAVILRGGMDGLAVVAPVGDPSYEAVRDEFSMPLEGPDSGIPLDGFFVLNPRMATVADLYRRGEALFVHATHTSYRARSHFEAQDVLENGTTSQNHHADGWLGRALKGMPADDRVARDGAFAAATATPLTLRGAPHVINWLPPGFDEASADTRQRLLMMYEHTDPVLAKALGEGLDLARITGSEMEMGAAVETMMMGLEAKGRQRAVVAAATAAGRSMARDDGPRVGFLDMSGFDTHLRQSVVSGRIGETLTSLDVAISALRDALGPAWANTVVAVMTEFGRTVHMNGSDGTDHGTATVAMLLGGAVKGGRIVADWPGLAPNALYEGRDLAPTTDVRAVLKGAMRDHLGLSPATLGGVIFPGTEGLRPIDGLVHGV